MSVGYCSRQRGVTDVAGGEAAPSGWGRGAGEAAGLRPPREGPTPPEAQSPTSSSGAEGKAQSKLRSPSRDRAWRGQLARVLIRHGGLGLRSRMDGYICLHQVLELPLVRPDLPLRHMWPTRLSQQKLAHLWPHSSVARGDISHR